MRAVILGCTGAIGGATAQLLANAGWHVDMTRRDLTAMPAALDAAGIRFHKVERSQTAQIEHLVGDGVDPHVDAVAYAAADVRGLLPASCWPPERAEASIDGMPRTSSCWAGRRARARV